MMNNKFLLIAMFVAIIAISGCAEIQEARRSQIFVEEYLGDLNQSGGEESVPMPESWKFPQVVESARSISPNNVEGKPFDRFGRVYSSNELSKLVLSSMSAEELQKYADVVTHAYPDAVAKDFPADCDTLSVGQLNETAVAGVAYISINAVNPNTREQAKVCLAAIQTNFLGAGR